MQYISSCAEVLIKTWPFYTLLLTAHCSCFSISDSIFFTFIFVSARIDYNYPVIIMWVSSGRKCSTIYFWFWLKMWILDKVSFLADWECSIQYTAFHSCPIIHCISSEFSVLEHRALQNHWLYHPTWMQVIFCNLYRTWLKYEIIKKCSTYILFYCFIVKLQEGLFHKNWFTFSAWHVMVFVGLLLISYPSFNTV